MSQHLFSEIPKVQIPRSMFRRNHNIKTTINTDYLYPVYVDEALPGDTFVFQGQFFGRLSTPIVPLMDGLYLDTFFFAVPIRLIDENFRKIMGERPFGDTTSDFTTPVLNSGDSGVASLSLSDYLGIPINVPNLDFCAYWHRAYNLIYNEWFRDENLCEPAPIAGVFYDGTSTDEALSQYTLRKRGKRHDYFTSSLPWPQKGSESLVPLSGIAPVIGNGKALGIMTLESDSNKVHPLQTSVTSGSYGGLVPATETPSTTLWPSVGAAHGTYPSSTTAFNGQYVGLSSAGSKSGVVADLSGVAPFSVNVLRQSIAIQRLLELDARGGSRLIEIIRAHFGVVSPDARMQRPEYLGGFSENMKVTTVAQTSSTDSTSPQGNLSAFVTVGSGAHWIKSFTEHCVILGLANVRADLSYQQGLPRMFSRRTRYDFYWPALANLGEQAVLNKEIFAQGKSVTSDGKIVDDGVFGYQERWAEYRYHPNMITGLFRSTASGTLDYWHLAQKFDNLPTLNQSFIEEAVPIGRALAVPSEPAVILDAYYDIKCARPMPLYSVPSMGSRF